MHISPFIGHIPDLSRTDFDDAFYQNLREDFNQMFDKGLFRQVSDKPCYFVIEIQNKNKISTGLVASTSMQDYVDHHILKHEQTISKKEKLHHALLTTRKAMIKPVALLMPPMTILNTYFNDLKKNNKPILRIKFPDAVTTQKLWKIDSPIWIQKITSLFEKKIDQVVIADGHHRFSTLARMHKTQKPLSILSVYFTPDQMQVSTFYRIIRKKEKQSYNNLIAKLRQQTIGWKKTEKIVDTPGHIQVVLRREIFQFKLKKTLDQPIHLSFSNQILGTVFQIFRETASKRISYIEAPENENAYHHIFDKYPDEFIFILPAMTTQQILHNQKILPPKSTLFSPRIINGLIVTLA